MHYKNKTFSKKMASCYYHYQFYSNYLYSNFCIPINIILILIDIIFIIILVTVLVLLLLLLLLFHPFIYEIKMTKSNVQHNWQEQRERKTPNHSNNFCPEACNWAIIFHLNWKDSNKKWKFCTLCMIANAIKARTVSCSRRQKD